MTVMALFAAHRIFQTADSVLHLACNLLGIALRLDAFVANYLDGRHFFFLATACLIGR